MSVRVRQAEAKDAPSLVALLNPIIEAGRYTVMDEPATLESQRAFLEGFPARGVIHVAVDDQTRDVLGIQDVVPTEKGGEISTFVRLDAHRQGIGRALMAATLAAAAERGYGRVVARVRAHNPGAVAFYASQGFRTIGVAERYARLRGRHVDGVTMERLL